MGALHDHITRQGEKVRAMKAAKASKVGSGGSSFPSKKQDSKFSRTWTIYSSVFKGL